MSDSIHAVSYNSNGVMKPATSSTTHSSQETERADSGKSTPSNIFMTMAALVLLLAAVLTSYVAGQALWGTAALIVLTLLSHRIAIFNDVSGLAKALLVYCLLDFLINNLGLAYPYSNIFIVTGLLGLFFTSGLNWKTFYFGPGQSGAWGKKALLSGVLIAVVILGVFYLQPGVLGENPTPKEWPIDVLIVVGLGYATFSALIEETIFRSTILAFARQHLGIIPAVIAQAVVFGAMHYRISFPSESLGAVFALFWGLIAGWITVKADSIYPAYLMHFVVVLILFIGLAFAP